MGKMKKGFIFSLSSIMLVAIISTIIGMNASIERAKTELELTSLRVAIMNNYVSDFEDSYLENILYVSGKYMLGMLAENGVPAGKGFDDVFPQLLINGSYRQGSSLVAIGGSGAKSFNFFRNEIEPKLEEAGINIVDFDAELVEIRQDSPWTVELTVDFKYNLQDKNNVSAWDGSIRKKASISIIGLKNPEGNDVIVNDFKDGRWVENPNPLASSDQYMSFLTMLSGEGGYNINGICIKQIFTYPMCICKLTGFLNVKITYCCNQDSTI